MDELISRQAAIDSMCELMRHWFGCNPKDEIREIKRELGKLPTIEPEQRWIPCGEKMPECEQEVLICTKKKVYVGRKSGFEWIEKPIITPALYEDGTMLEINSKWHWEDIDYAGWDEEEDCGIIPEGWWENRHFNPDEVYNNPVDREVIAWMPLTEPYKEEKE